MSNYLKLFKKEFEKYARPAPSRPASELPAPAPTTTPAATTPAATPTKRKSAPSRNIPNGDKPAAKSNIGYDNRTVIEMQKALQDLAKAVTSQIKIEDMAESSSSPTKVEPSREAGEAAHRNSFNDFIAKTYLRNSDVPGVEFDPTPTKTQMADKQPSQPTRMGVIMNTMSRIGNPLKGENFADGKWGPRTNAGLRNAYAFAYAMLKLASEFEVKNITAYNNDALKQFVIKDSDKDYTPEEKKQNAPIFTKHIRAIIKMYEQIKANILEKPAYQTYIEGHPYATFEPDNSSAPPITLDSQSIKDLQDKFKTGFDILITNTGKTVPIFIQDLANLTTLHEWQKNNGSKMKDADVIKQVKDRAAGLSIRPAPAQATPQPSVGRK